MADWTIEEYEEYKESLRVLEDHYECVGPGWRPVLEALNDSFKTMLAEYNICKRVAASIDILQVKEKFGGLRCYVCIQGFSEEDSRIIHANITFAERMVMYMCEDCTYPKTENRARDNAKFGWIRNLCAEHHKALDTKKTPG